MEQRLLSQRRDEARTLDETLDRAWEALRVLPRRELTMLPNAVLEPGTPGLPRGVSAMAKLLHMPPGRAGRLWLQHRLSTAQHGADLLDHKLGILRTEREQLALQRDMMAPSGNPRAARRTSGCCAEFCSAGSGRSGSPPHRRPLRSASSGSSRWACAIGRGHLHRAGPLAGRAAARQRRAGRGTCCYRRAVQAAVQQAAVETAVAFSRRKRRPLVADSGPSRTGGSRACGRP